jgi:hypothetical protein
MVLIRNRTRKKSVFSNSLGPDPDSATAWIRIWIQKKYLSDPDSLTMDPTHWVKYPTLARIV